MSLVPMVVEQTSRGERSFDIFSRLNSIGVLQIKKNLRKENFTPAENTQEYFLLYRSILPLSGGKKWIRDLKKYLRDL